MPAPTRNRIAKNTLCSPTMLSLNLAHILRSSEANACGRNHYRRGNCGEEDDVARLMCNGKRRANNVAENKILVERTRSKDPAAKVREHIISKGCQKPDQSEYDAEPLILPRPLYKIPGHEAL